MNPEFLNIQEVSQYLGIKAGTLYAMAESRAIPHYKIGRLIRFRKSEIDEWMRDHKREYIPPGNGAPRFPGKPEKNLNVGEIIRKTIAKAKQEQYNIPSGKIGPYQGPREKGGKNGAL
jgi:excisionase family DNA binding protein